MKYLKSFENNVLDDVLDKISKNGIKSLTPSENKLLKNYFKGDTKELENIVRQNKNKVEGILDYDPREDSMFFKKLSDKTLIPFDFSEYNDDEIEEEKYGIIWDELDEEDVDHFVQFFDIKDAKVKDYYKDWDSLSKETQNLFKKYIDKIY